MRPWCCFSVVASDRTLDIICASTEDCYVWLARRSPPPFSSRVRTMTSEAALHQWCISAPWSPFLASVLITRLARPLNATAAMCPGSLAGSGCAGRGSSFIAVVKCHEFEEGFTVAQDANPRQTWRPSASINRDRSEYC